jgi:hypothetical protein
MESRLVVGSTQAGLPGVRSGRPGGLQHGAGTGKDVVRRILAPSARPGPSKKC